MKRLANWDRPHNRYVEKLFIHVQHFSPVDVSAPRHVQVEQRFRFVLRVIAAVEPTLPTPLKGLADAVVPPDYMPKPLTLQNAVEMLAILLSALCMGPFIFETAKPFFEEEREVLDALRESMGRPDSPSPAEGVVPANAHYHDAVDDAPGSHVMVESPPGSGIPHVDPLQQVDPRIVYRMDFESQHIVPASFGDEGPFYQIDPSTGRLAPWVSHAKPSRDARSTVLPRVTVPPERHIDPAIADLQRKLAELECRPVAELGGLRAPQVPGGSDGGMPRVNTMTRPFKAVHTEPELWWTEFAAGASLRDFEEEVRLQYVTSPSRDHLGFPYWSAAILLEQERDLKHLSDLVKEKLDRYDQDGCGGLELSLIMTLEGRLVAAAAGKTEASKFEKRHLDLTDKSEVLRDLWKGVKLPGASLRGDKAAERDDVPLPRKAPKAGGKVGKGRGKGEPPRSRSTSPNEVPPKVDVPNKKAQPGFDQEKFKKFPADVQREINSMRRAGEAWARDESKRLLALALSKRS